MYLAKLKWSHVRVGWGFTTIWNGAFELKCLRGECHVVRETEMVAMKLQELMVTSEIKGANQILLYSH